MKLARKLLAIILSVLVAGLYSTQVFAVSSYYISDVMVAYGSTLAEAKSKLTNAGYTAIPSDVNDGNGSCVAIGYKKTRDKTKAIRDLSVMNMNGNYSFEEYDNVLKEYKEEADELREQLSDAITEYRANYNAGKAGAKFAYTMLNDLVDEDYEDGKNGMGTIFLNENLTDDELTTIFMQCSTIALNTMQKYLAIACSNNWIDNLLNGNYEKTYDVSTDDDAAKLFDALTNFQPQMKKYENLCKTYGVTIDSSEEELKKFINENSEANTEDVRNFETYGMIHKYLENTKYGNGTLLDFFMQDLDNMELTVLYPIVASMTKGQIAAVRYVGLVSLVQNAITTDENLLKAIDSINPGDDNTVSVFAGIDRSIFDGDGIAVTMETFRQATSKSDTTWYKGNLPKAAETTMYAIAGVAAGVSLIAAGTFLVAKGFAAQTLLVDAGEALFLEDGMAAIRGVIDVYPMAGEVASVAGTIAWVAIAVALIVAAVYLIAEAIEYNKSKRKIEYTEIPRIIVDTNKDEKGNRNYIYYYAAKDTDGKYADLNNWSSDEWLALYYTTDENAGEPVRASFLAQSANTCTNTSYNCVLDSFSTDAAVNLNAYSKNSGNAVYLFYISDEPSTLTGTSTGSTGMYAVTGAAGIAVGAIGMFIINKLLNKKKKDTVEA